MSMYPGGYYPPPQPYPGPPGYQGYPGYPGYPQPPAGPRNGMGIAALVLGVVAMLSTWSVIGGLIFGITAAIVGLLAYRRVRRQEADNGAVALAGLVLGALSVVVSLIFIPIWSGFADQIGYSQYTACMNEAGKNERMINACLVQFQHRIDDTLGTNTSG